MIDSKVSIGSGMEKFNFTPDTCREVGRGKEGATTTGRTGVSRGTPSPPKLAG